jgi:hypothetical protein
MNLGDAVTTSLRILHDAHGELSEHQQKELDWIHSQLCEDDQQMLSLAILTSQLMARSNS